MKAITGSRPSEARKPKKRLTFRISPKEEAFAQGIAAGKNQSDAYRAAYDTRAKPEVIAVAANRVANRARVAQRLNELRNMAARPAILTRQRKPTRTAAQRTVNRCQGLTSR